MLCFANLFHAKSQHIIQKYSGNYNLSETLQGRALFDFYTVDGDTIKNGDFRFQQFIEHYQDSDTIHGFVLNGTYNNNVKNGPWRYVSRDFTISGNPQALDARVVYDVTGREFLIHSHFDQGMAHGTYEILHRSLVESQPSDTSFYVQLNFESGEVNGNLKGFSHNLIAEGQFDDDGFPHGDWIFTHQSDSTPPIQEIRRYDHGFFNKHFYEINDELHEIKHVGFDTIARSGLGMLTRVPITSTYFRALDYTDIVMDTSTIQLHFEEGDFQLLIAKTNNFLEKAMVNPASHENENVWTKIPGSIPIQPIRIKVSKHVFSAEESALNVSSEKYLLETLSIIRNFLNNPMIQINRYSSEPLSFNYKILEIYEKQLIKLAPVVRFLNDEASEYVDHEAILKYNTTDISYPKTVSYDFEDSTTSAIHNFPPAMNQYSVMEINKYIAYIFEDVNQLIEKSTPYLQDFEAQSDLVEKEELLIQRKDSIENLYTDIDSTDFHRDIHRQLEDSILSTVEQSFKTYSARTAAQRLLEIDSLLSCFHEYILMYEQLTDIDNRIQEINEEYTRSVWNAYTYTYMEERVKERLYTIYNDILLPYHITKLKEQRFCGDLQREVKNIDNLLFRMLQLRMEDTKVLERQLRRADKSEQTYLTILGLDPQ